jgi:hypothetical protein
MEIQVNEYGQAPKQLFKSPHPKKYSNSIDQLIVEREIEDKEKQDEYIEKESKVTIPQKITAIYNLDRVFTCLPKFHKKYLLLILEVSQLRYSKMRIKLSLLDRQMELLNYTTIKITN